MPATSAPLVIDASAAVWAIVPTLAAKGVDVSARFTSWNEADVQFVAPIWWMAECTSALRRGVYLHTLLAAEAHTALNDILALEIELVDLTPVLCHAALDWAGRLRQIRAYDAFYLALAEQLGVDLWSADQRLVNGARQAGVTWVRWIGES